MKVQQAETPNTEQHVTKQGSREQEAENWKDFLQAIDTPRDELIVDVRGGGDPRLYLKSMGNAHDHPQPWRSRLPKRIFDLVTASLLLAVTAPIMAIVAAGIALTGGGPVLFKQQRVGRNGRIFECLKFRTMRVDAEVVLRELIETNHEFRQGLLDDLKPADDPRITPMGHYLRRYSLDELPQLINVLRGQMSIVGPRPYLIYETVRLGEALPLVLAVKPGLTGLWQTSGRNGLGFTDRVELDTEYALNRTIRLDLTICAQTAAVVARGSGAR